MSKCDLHLFISYYYAITSRKQNQFSVNVCLIYSAVYTKSTTDPYQTQICYTFICCRNTNRDLHKSDKDVVITTGVCGRSHFTCDLVTVFWSSLGSSVPPGRAKPLSTPDKSSTRTLDGRRRRGGIGRGSGVLLA